VKKSYKITLGIALLVCILVVFLYLGNYRLTGIDAAKSHFTIGEDAELIDEIDIGWGKVFIFKTKDGYYRTALSEKSGFLWRCKVAVFIKDNPEDKVKTIGWMSYTNKNREQITVLAVTTTDSRVAFIETGSEPNRYRIPISLKKIAVFKCNKVMNIQELNAVALSTNGKKLYYYGYPNKTTIIVNEDLRWYPILKD